MKDLEIIEQYSVGSFVAVGKEYFCIEKVDAHTYLLNIRHRETIGDLEDFKQEFFEKLEKKYDSDEYDEKFHSGEFDELWSKQPIPNEINGKRVSKVEDGHFLLGEDLICYNKDCEIKFTEFDDQVKAFIDTLSENNTVIAENKVEIYRKIENYLLS